MTIPNLITTLRIILTPVFVIYILNDQLTNGLIVLILCGVSDGLDGLIARVFNQKSRLGAYLDPLADKIIIISAFITIGVRGLVPSWLIVMVISRDVLILIGVVFLFFNSFHIIVRPLISSKITTCLQFFTVILVLSNDFLPAVEPYYTALFYLTAFFTIVSFFQYMHQWFTLIGEPRE